MNKEILKKIKNLRNFRGYLKEFPPTTYGGKDTIKGINNLIKKTVNKDINSKVKFIRVRGRVIPVKRKL